MEEGEVERLSVIDDGRRRRKGEKEEERGTR